MEPIRVGINGMGNIGRLAFRVLQSYQEEGVIDIVAVNNRSRTPEQMAYLVKWDSLYGRFDGSLGYDDKHLIVNGRNVEVLKESSTRNLPWGDLGVKVVLESTGRFRKAEGGEGGYMDHIEQGAEYVVISAPPKDDLAKTVVIGVSFDPRKPETYKPIFERYRAISNASCSANCIVPLLYVIGALGIEKGDATIIHAYTGSQELQDGYSKDFTKGRAAGLNISPTGSGLSDSIASIFPNLVDKVDLIEANTYRVPVPVVSMAQLLLNVREEASKDRINEAFLEASKASLEGILEYSPEKHMTSTMLKGNPHSSVLESLATSNPWNDQHWIRVRSWFDNQWGYANRTAELIVKIAEHISRRKE